MDCDSTPIVPPFPQSDDGHRRIVWNTTDLTTWTTAGVTHELVTSEAGTETWRGRYPLASATNLFFRREDHAAVRSNQTPPL
jgi:hypothetical protein